MPRAKNARTQSLTGKFTLAEERAINELVEAKGAADKSHFVRWLVLREIRRASRPKRPSHAWTMLQLFVGTMRQSLDGDELRRFNALCDELGVRTKR